MTVWSTMDKPGGNSVAMRLAERSDHATWSWIKQSDGKVGLSIEISNGEVPLPEIPISKHFEVKEKHYKDCKPMLTLICTDHEFFEIFETLCHDLIDYSKSLNTVEQLLSGIKNRILVWYELFKKDFRGLTKKQVIGLAAELTFLKTWTSLIGENLSTWLGPTNSPQDFIAKSNVWGVEVKSTGWVLADIKISSLYQLDFPGVLYIAVFPSRLVERNEEGASNLDEIVESIERDLDPSKLLEFQTKLLLSGYVPKKFSDIFFELGKPVFYKVTEDFPKLTRRNTDSSISDCNYSVTLSNLEIFKVPFEEVGVRS
jgi:hypothetical protein